ncbi:alpha/beta fold hydrolase [Ralstonia sp. UBA689]|uniref:alpha/beta fold hydrolase n=1 Tax=Ralstonia sp. UBA689 TaxID=1947373 RepID=UPI0025EB33CB|nr:alpha/beta hydrolase [Ralstonia sp. UBA689]
MAFPHLAKELPVDVSSSAHACGAAPAFVEFAARAGLPGWREAGTGRPLLLLHGWSVSGEVFDGQRALALQGYRVIAPDHAGHGLSAALRPSGATIAGLTADAAALMRHLELDDAVVVGWSMGAMVAWELMRSQPSLRIAMIGSIDMTPRLVTSPDWSHGLHGHYDMAQAAQMATRIRQRWESLMAPVAAGLWAAGVQPDTGLTRDVMRMMRQCAPGTLAALWEDMARQDFRVLLQAARWPLFHLYGERSRLYAPDVGRATLALHPAAQVATIPGTGHAPHLERPDAFNAVLLQMLRAQESTR